MQHFADRVENETISTAVLVDVFVSHAMRNADDLQGGFGDISEFPNVAQLNALIDNLELASDTGMMHRVTQEMLDRPYYHGSLIVSRANSQR